MKLNENFTLKHTSYNPYYFNYKNITIKLSYVQEKEGFPSIEVFNRTEESQKNEWHIYGGNDEVVKKISFQIKNEVKIFIVEDVAYEIQFLNTKKEVYEYPKSKEIIEVYTFRIRNNLSSL